MFEQYFSKAPEQEIEAADYAYSGKLLLKQNKDSLAIQLKLNELVAAHEFASNRLVSVENMTEDELKVIKKYYAYLSEFAKKEETLQQSHSIDEAAASHEFKKKLEQELEGNAKPEKGS